MTPSYRLHALAFAIALGIVAAAQPARADDAFEFVALGDMPYKLPDDYKRFETLIAAINKVKPAFSIHVGDIKSGSTPCSDELIEKVHGYFKTFQQPLIYTPGDNEWTDCHREKAGKFNPLERLAFVRKLFFSDDKSQGAAPITVTRQADVGDFKDMVENARWSHGGVVFATLDVVGSNNNLDRNAESADEFYKRNAANVAWIEDAFAQAKKDGAKGAVFALQANLHFEVDPEINAGFHDTINALTKGALDFGKPVLIIQGDEHVFIVDQPLKDKDDNPIETAFRLQVMGRAPGRRRARARRPGRCHPVFVPAAGAAGEPEPAGDVGTRPGRRASDRHGIDLAGRAGRECAGDHPPATIFRRHARTGPA